MAGDGFGGSVAISGSTALVGAIGVGDSGSAYLFDVSNRSAPVQTAKLLPSDGGKGFDGFGSSVAISGTTAIVGAELWNYLIGSAYLFDVSNPSVPVQTAQLHSGSGMPDQNFGQSVAISGTTAIVGAPNTTDHFDQVGSAYLFDTTTGQLMAELYPSYPSDWLHFGSSVAISGTTAIVGASGDYGFDPTYTGSASMIDVTTGQQVGKLFASDGASGGFGRSAAISGNTAIVGAPAGDGIVTASGSAYVFGPFQPASWSSRSGILGLNPMDYTCSNAPVLGTTWMTQINTTPSVGSVTVLTFVAVGLGGPTEGILLFGHELLILPPFLSSSEVGTGLGAHDFPVPSDLALIGLSGSWQGARLEVVPSGPFFLVLTNALDAVYGL